MAQDNENLSNDGLEKVLNSVLSDPESMSRLAGMASALASSGVLSGLMGGEKPSAEAENPSGGDAADVAVLSNERGGGATGSSLHSVSGRHTALLRALKPYLGQEKQTRIDQMMKLLQLAELADTVLRGK